MAVYLPRQVETQAFRYGYDIEADWFALLKLTGNVTKEVEGGFTLTIGENSVFVPFGSYIVLTPYGKVEFYSKDDFHKRYEQKQ